MTDFWRELKRLVRKAERAALGNKYEPYANAYHDMLRHVEIHKPRRVRVKKTKGARND